MCSTVSSDSACRVLVLGAHPDDAEVSAGGLIVRHRQAGSTVRMISVTDGRCGHHERPGEQLVAERRQEAAASGRSIGAEYLTWDFADGSLEPSLPVREALIREIRSFAPDLVLTHRPYDYHPDHRAVGTAVQDASYLVTVPHVCPDQPALTRDPIVAYMCDLFTRPTKMRADVLLDIRDEWPTLIQMAACHQSQFFEWLPFHAGELHQVPEDPAERITWLSNWLEPHHRTRVKHFQAELLERNVSPPPDFKLEVYEISEYASAMEPDHRRRLFPGAL